jgi:hypothetical protein
VDNIDYIWLIGFNIGKIFDGVYKDNNCFEILIYFIV